MNDDPTERHLMRTSLACSIALIALLASSLRAADDATLTALKTADDARLRATLSGDVSKLSPILSDELRYAHSSGAVDSKASFLESLASGKLKYAQFDYRERNFTMVAPHVAVMTGRANVRVGSTAAPSDMVLGFLAVWREEQG